MRGCAVQGSRQTPAAAPCAPVLPHLLEENSILGVIYGVVLWADMNAATPLGARGRSVMSLACVAYSWCVCVRMRMCVRGVFLVRMRACAHVRAQRGCSEDAPNVDDVFGGASGKGAKGDHTVRKLAIFRGLGLCGKNNVRQKSG